MSELTKIITVTCPSNVDWGLDFTSDSGVEYHMTFSLERGYSCNCKGFTYRGWCKHVRDTELTLQRCGWGEDSYANTIRDDEFCPECGEKTHAFYIGV